MSIHEDGEDSTALGGHETLEMGSKLAKYVLNYEAGGRVMKRKDVVELVGLAGRRSSARIRHVIAAANALLSKFGLELVPLVLRDFPDGVKAPTRDTEYALVSTASRQARIFIGRAADSHMTRHLGLLDSVVLFIILNGGNGLQTSALIDQLRAAGLVGNGESEAEEVRDSLDALARERFLVHVTPEGADGATRKTYYIGPRSQLVMDAESLFGRIANIMWHPEETEQERLEEEKKTLKEFIFKSGFGLSGEAESAASQARQAPP